MEAVIAAGEQTELPVLLLAGSSHFRHADRRLLAVLALTAAHNARTEAGCTSITAAISTNCDGASPAAAR